MNRRTIQNAAAFLFWCVGLATAGLLTASLAGRTPALIPVSIAAWACFVYCAGAAVLWLRILTARKSFFHCGGEDILIVAPHPDDCVAIAGGYAIQTLARGGRVRVLYVAPGSESDRDVRMAEAKDAWSLAGAGRLELRFLGHRSGTGLMTRAEIDACAGEIADQIRDFSPGTVFVPLYEGGNFQHDAVNFMTRRASERTGFKGRFLEAPEYNFHLSFATTPEKILSGLARFIPFERHDYAPEPVRPAPVLRLAMTGPELRLKREMLSRFTTQNPDRLVERFGFEDRFQELPPHDYSKPPFDYDRSAARRINALKSFPATAGVFSAMFKWTRTIHADPDYIITRIPGERPPSDAEARGRRS
jgi:LmbE family N-acetylglucosaminyl deacetylase